MHCLAPAPVSYDPNRLLDSLIHQLGVTSDKALSRELQIARHVLARLRSGVQPVSASMLMWISERAGTSIDEIRRLLGDRRAISRLTVPLLCSGAKRHAKAAARASVTVHAGDDGASKPVAASMPSAPASIVSRTSC